MQDGQKAVWSIPYVSVAFFPSLKHNFIAYCSSKVSSCPNCIFEIHQLWQSGFSRVYSNSCCSCSFESEILKIGQSSHKMYSNNIVNFQESMTILNACTKKSGNLLQTPHTSWQSSRTFSNDNSNGFHTKSNYSSLGWGKYWLNSFTNAVKCCSNHVYKSDILKPTVQEIVVLNLMGCQSVFPIPNKNLKFTPWVNSPLVENPVLDL